MAEKIGYDVGHKISEGMTVSSSPKSMKNKICYPSIHLTDEELPLLEELEVGDKVSFLCLFRLSGKNERAEDKKCNYDLELIKVIEEGEGNLTKGFEKKVKEFFGEHKEAEVNKETEKEED